MAFAMVSLPRSLAPVLFLCGLSSARAASVEIDAMKHDIQQITMSNFDGVISKFRDSAVSSLWFFKADNKADVSFLEEYNKVAGDLKGMAKISRSVARIGLSSATSRA